MSYNKYSKYPLLAHMQLWRCLPHWSVASSITLLLHSSPTINQMLPHIVHILHFCLVDSLLHYSPDFIVNWIEAGVVGRSKICRDECRSLVLKEADRLVHSVRWDTVLLKDEELTRYLTYGRQQLL